MFGAKLQNATKLRVEYVGKFNFYTAITSKVNICSN